MRYVATFPSLTALRRGDTPRSVHALSSLPRVTPGGEVAGATLCGARLLYGGPWRETTTRSLACPRCIAAMRRLTA